MGSHVLDIEYDLHRQLMNELSTLGLDHVTFGLVFAQSLKGIEHYGLDSSMAPGFDTWSEVLCELADALALSTAYHTRRCKAGLDAQQGALRQRAVDAIVQAIHAVQELGHEQREWRKEKAKPITRESLGLGPLPVRTAPTEVTTPPELRLIGVLCPWCGGQAKNLILRSPHGEAVFVDAQCSSCERELTIEVAVPGGLQETETPDPDDIYRPAHMAGDVTPPLTPAIEKELL